MKDGLVNLIWKTGIRMFRISRRVNLSTRLEPLFVRIGSLVPASKRPQSARLADGSTLWMPPGYRDARTVTVGLFQEAETKLFRQVLRPGMTFVDVGSYVGYFAVLASDLVGPGGHVYAFEPDGLAYEYLTKNLRVNRCANTVPVNKAVSDAIATATLVRDPKGPESFLTREPLSSQSTMVETVTLDSFFKGEGWPTIDVIKMNIEGSELAALSGMTETSHRNPGLRLVLEFNPSAMRRGAVSSKRLTDTLAELGFRKGQIVERRLSVLPQGQLVPTGGAVYNILLTKE
jgi:FkbM family methyltransferase